MAVDLTDHVIRNEGLMAAPVDEDLVILSLISNNYIALDPIGRRIWELLESTWQVDELCLQLGQEFAGAPDQIAADVLPFLTELQGEGIVHVVGEQTA